VCQPSTRSSHEFLSLLALPRTFQDYQYCCHAHSRPRNKNKTLTTNLNLKTTVYMKCYNLPYTMSRTTIDIVDGNLVGSVYYGNTIISGFNGVFGYSNTDGVADMNSIGVGAFIWCSELKSSESDVSTISHKYVKPFGVYGFNILYNSILNSVEIYTLHFQI